MSNWKDSLVKVEYRDISENVFRLIGDDWFLITAGTADDFNTMTASWGTLGIFWNKPIAICFIRPTRHTYNYSEEEDFFSISFLKEGNRKILNFCGSKSGREHDKIEETGLLPIELENGTITYQQAKLVLECKKIYFDDLKPVFFMPDDADEKFYPNKDYHRMYFGEIIAAYKAK